ncbi:hypothetical protein [Actinoallomurus sp. CA-150999]|uniref:hypothetical protein n=1 Tax=Actinoallomurus sp. CA-150999 TaxID=3239887 RepID=UPI003D927F63
MNHIPLITDAEPRRFDVRGIARGIWSVVVLLVSAVDHYLAALFGIPPLAWCARQIGGVIRDAYRQGRYGPASDCTTVVQAVYDGEFVDDQPQRKETR